MNNLRVYRKLERGEFIVAGYDLSSGMSDSCAIQFVSKTKLDVPLVYHARVLATEATNSVYPILDRIYDLTGVRPVIAPERNAGGVFEAERLATLNRSGKFLIYKMPNVGKIENAEPTKLGWDTNTSTRPRMLSDLKEAVDKQLLTVYDKPTINEMYSFIISRTSTVEKAQAENGAHDDLVMSLAIAWQLYQSQNPPSSPIDPSMLPKHEPSDSVIGI